MEVGGSYIQDCPGQRERNKAEEYSVPGKQFQNQKLKASLILK